MKCHEVGALVKLVEHPFAADSDCLMRLQHDLSVARYLAREISVAIHQQICEKWKLVRQRAGGDASKTTSKISAV